MRIACMMSDFRAARIFGRFSTSGIRNLNLLYIDAPLYSERSLRGSLQRSRCAAYYGYRARVTAIEDLLSSHRSDPVMTADRICVLLTAKDKYLSAMIYGARRCLPYFRALLTTISAFGRYRDKRKFLIELTKTLLFPVFAISAEGTQSARMRTQAIKTANEHAINQRRRKIRSTPK